MEGLLKDELVHFWNGIAEVHGHHLREAEYHPLMLQ